MMKKAIPLVLLGLAVTILPSCGSSNNNDNPTPVPTPTPGPVTTSLYSQAYSVAAPQDTNHFIYGYQDVTVPYAGTVTAAFAWTYATSQIEMVVTNTSCADPISAYTGGCTVYSADHRHVIPATATFPMTSAGAIRVWVYNFSLVAESGVMNVTILH